MKLSYFKQNSQIKYLNNKQIKLDLYCVFSKIMNIEKFDLCYI